MTAHLGNWEISAATAPHLGLPLTVVYSVQANPLTEWLVQRQRRHLRCRFLATEGGMRPLLQELQAGRSIGLLVDVRVKSGDDLPFCGRATTTTLVPARLALNTAVLWSRCAWSGCARRTCASPCTIPCCRTTARRRSFRLAA